MYKALIIGCGRIAGGGPNAGLETQAGAINAEIRLTLSACVDTNKEKAQFFARRYDCKAYSDTQAALNENKIDVVSICTPDNTHYTIACSVIESFSRPRVLFLEKPACSTKEEYSTLRGLADFYGVMLVVNHTRRFNPQYKILRDMLLSKQLGSMYRVNATYYGGWFHNGVHVVDTLNYLMDGEIEWVHVDNVIPSPYQDDPTLELTGTVRDSKIRVVVSAIDEKLYQLFDFDFWCHYGRLRIENFGKCIRLEKKATNSIGEHVVEQVEHKVPTNMKTEMQIALGYICDYLGSGDSRKLAPVSINAIETTLQSLWQGRDLYNQYY